MAPICSGTKKNGQPCQFRGRYNGFCKFHEPKELPDCPICYDTISVKDSKVTSCKHEFHSSCLERWTKDHSTCPMCRTLVAPKPPTEPRLHVRSVVPAFWFVMNGRTYNFGESVFEVGDY